ncbi:hypothetical protein AMECASPLE_026818 [Ameca splendens]|uniref:Uncharacterized protein n=1 Tax=Ameca splendens TaxID=208324 RepID=A0ABV1ABC7_9TELE
MNLCCWHEEFLREGFFDPPGTVSVGGPPPSSFQAPVPVLGFPAASLVSPAVSQGSPAASLEPYAALQDSSGSRTASQSVSEFKSPQFQPAAKSLGPQLTDKITEPPRGV